MTTKQKNQVERVKGEIDPRLFKLHFGRAMPFIDGLIEVIKNSIDAAATLVMIFTSEDKLFIIRDNGSGMMKDQRDAWTGLGKSTSREDISKAGQNGSGKAHFGYPLATHVTVVTAPADQQNVVYQIRIDLEEYFYKLLRGEYFDWEILPKSSESWPYEHETGTVLTYEVRRNKRPQRGNTLAKSLAARLTSFTARRVRVDDKPLPEREIIGSDFNESKARRGISNVDFDLYNPKDVQDTDRLRLTGNIVGEVPMTALLELLPAEMRAKVPSVFKQASCCGVIRHPIFAEYAQDSRKGFDEALLRDTRLSLFLKVLEEVAPEVENRLEINVERSDKAGKGQAVISDLAEICRRTWGSKKSGPTEEEKKEEQESSSSGDPKPRDFYLHLATSHDGGVTEIEIGEYVDVTPVVNLDLLGLSEMPQLDWVWDKAPGHKSSIVNNGFRVRPDSEGVCKVTVYAGDLRHTSCCYRVVEKREPRLSATDIEVGLDKSFRIRLLNADKANGKITWKCQGSQGNLEVADNGRSALFKGEGLGMCQVSVSIGKQSNELLECRISVVDSEKVGELVLIESRPFRLLHDSWGGKDLFQIFWPQNETLPGDILINTTSEIYLRLERLGSREMLGALFPLMLQAYSARRLAQDGVLPDEPLMPLSIPDFVQKEVVGTSIELLSQSYAVMEDGKSDKKKAGKNASGRHKR